MRLSVGTLIGTTIPAVDWKWNDHFGIHEERSLLCSRLRRTQTSYPSVVQSLQVRTTLCGVFYDLLQHSTESLSEWQGSRNGLEFKAGLEAALNLKKLKSPWIKSAWIVFENDKKALKSFEFCWSQLNIWWKWINVDGDHVRLVVVTYTCWN